MSLTRPIEAMLLMATEPVMAADLAAALEVPEPEVVAALEEVADFYRDSGRGIEVRRVAGGWRLATSCQPPAASDPPHDPAAPRTHS